MNRNGEWMQTYTGKQFWPLDPRPEDIDIADIAHALSMTCRYNGHCKRFYSVAEHSVLVSRYVPAKHALWGLLHDAAEAYISDIVKPAKPYITGYQEAEEKIMRAVCDRFGLSHEMPQVVKYVDTSILADEAAQIMGPAPTDWNLPLPPLGVKIKGWEPYWAEYVFLRMYKTLTAGEDK